MDQDPIDLSDDSFSLDDTAGDLLRRPSLVVVGHDTFTWHHNSWPLVGCSGFVVGHSSAMLISVVAIKDLLGIDLESLRALSTFSKALEGKSAVFTEMESCKTFKIEPGEGLWILVGHVPLSTGVNFGGPTTTP